MSETAEGSFRAVEAERDQAVELLQALSDSWDDYKDPWKFGSDMAAARTWLAER